MSASAKSSDEIRQRLADVRGRIELSAELAGRDPVEVRLIAVSKTHPPGVVRAAIDAGVRDLGENRIQEADSKILAVGRKSATWHLIGHLQANKARRAVALFDVIHSLDSASLARRLDRLCEDAGRDRLPVLVQVDLAGETTKAGVSEADLADLIKVVTECSRLSLRGLMTLPPLFDDAELARPYFRRLRELRDALKAEDVFGDSEGELSMGMSNDFPVAVEEGATCVRVGTAIFGTRRETIDSDSDVDSKHSGP